MKQITIDNILNRKALIIECSERQIESLNYLINKLNSNELQSINYYINPIISMLNSGVSIGLYPRLRRIKTMGRKHSKVKNVLMYGKINGIDKWNRFCELNAYTNTFEYKAKRHGMTLEEFTAYNKSRSVTKENLIKRHGEEVGLLKWDSYVNKQKTAGISLEYFQDKLGDTQGLKKFMEVNSKKGHTLNNYIRLYGDKEIAIKKLEEFHAMVNDNQKFQSNTTKVFFDELDSKLSAHIREKTYYSPKTKEFCKYNPSINGVYMYDYVISSLKIVIEFNGDYWHANPKKYKPTDILRGALVEDIWKKDMIKQQFIESLGYDYYIVWESDCIKDTSSIMSKLYDIIIQKENNVRSEDPFLE